MTDDGIFIDEKAQREKTRNHNNKPERKRLMKKSNIMCVYGVVSASTTTCDNVRVYVRR